MNTTLTVSDRFTKKDSSGWMDADGNRQRHEYTILCEVVSTNAVGFEWRRLEVLEESNRPTTAELATVKGVTPTEGAFIATKGRTAWFGWEAAVNRGDAERVA